MLRIVTFGLLWSSLALAFPITWSIKSSGFSDGGVVRGFFVYDSDSDNVPYWDIETYLGNSGFLPFEFTPTNSFVLTQSRSQFAFVSNQLFPTGAASANLVLILVTTQPVTDLISSVTLDGSMSGECFNCDPARTLSYSPSLVAASVPMIAAPSSGSGGEQTFVFTFQDANGGQDLSVVNILINDSLDGRRACYLAFVPSGASSGTLDLVDDAGDAGGPFQGMTLPGNGTIGNSQCTIQGSTSSVSATNPSVFVGTNAGLVLTLDVTFNPSFAGNKIVYMASRNAAQVSSGWRRMGVWRAPDNAASGAISVAGMSPGRSIGDDFTQFTVTFSDTKGISDLGVANILIHNALDGRHSCYLAYSRPINVLYLMNDNGDALLPGKSMATGGSLGNSQCWITWNNTDAVTANGNSLTLTLEAMFYVSDLGDQVFYVAARDTSDGKNTGWQAMGTWTVVLQ